MIGMAHKNGNDALAEMSDYFDGLSKQPSAAMVLALEADLQTAFRASQAAMHVYTGASKASGRTSSEKDRIQAQWEGEISYGGPEIEGAYWEWYRKDRAAGGRLPSPHGAFFYVLDTMDPMWRATLMTGLD